MLRLFQCEITFHIFTKQCSFLTLLNRCDETMISHYETMISHCPRRNTVTSLHGFYVFYKMCRNIIHTLIQQCFFYLKLQQMQNQEPP